MAAAPPNSHTHQPPARPTTHRASRLLREYFEVEFSRVPPLPWAGGGAPDVERVVDDFVLFCMLVGNDFLPGGRARSELPAPRACPTAREEGAPGAAWW